MVVENQAVSQETTSNCSSEDSLNISFEDISYKVRRGIFAGVLGMKRSITPEIMDSEANNRPISPSLLRPTRSSIKEDKNKTRLRILSLNVVLLTSTTIEGMNTLPNY